MLFAQLPDAERELLRSAMRKMGSLGGQRRAAVLTPDRRREIAQKGRDSYKLKRERIKLEMERLKKEGSSAMSG